MTNRPNNADRIREFCIEKYINNSKNNIIVIRSGDVHDALNMRNRYPLVCSALGSRIFEKQARVKRIHVEGPINGANTIFIFKCLDD